ncbi:MAG TPA: hypothetical protein G4O02_13345 [Caldilineae bacterium]|jgi:hypothetical protein|nr:hypothetical protein [Caldilineae bacterium]
MNVEVFDRHGVKRDWDWLRDVYGNVMLLDGGPRPKFTLVRVDETEGPAVIVVRIQRLDGSPVVDQPVANHWPDPDLPSLEGGELKTLWRTTGVHQRTDRNGYTGFGLGPGSYILDPVLGGPHVIWVLSPSLRSDGISGVGMLPGTNHRGPLHLTFVLDDRSPEEVIEPPPSEREATLAELLAEMRVIRSVLESLADHLGVTTR